MFGGFMHITTERAGKPGGFRLYLRLLIALGLAVFAAPFLASSASAEPDVGKVVVCKYSHTPETGELAQTIIIVSANALEGDGFEGEFPFFFSDQHNSSIAIRYAEVGEQPNELELGECPPFPGVDECPELPGDQEEGFQCEPLSETDTRDVGPTVDCPAGTVTTLHQERTRTQEFVDGAWVWGAWSEWVTVDTTVVDTTEEQCPTVDPPGPVVDPPPPPNPPEPPSPVVNPPAPVLPQTGLSDYLGAIALLTGLALTGGLLLLRRSSRIGTPSS